MDPTFIAPAVVPGPSLSGVSTGALDLESDSHQSPPVVYLLVYLTGTIVYVFYDDINIVR